MDRAGEEGGHAACIPSSDCSASTFDHLIMVARYCLMRAANAKRPARPN